MFTPGKDQPFIIDKHRSSYAQLSKSNAIVVKKVRWSTKQFEDFCMVPLDFKGNGLTVTDCSLGPESAAALANFWR